MGANKNNFAAILMLILWCFCLPFVANAAPPSVTLTSPLDNALYVTPASFTLSATASTPNAGATITKVEWYRNGALLGSDATSPYSAGQSGIASGTYTYTAKAIDSTGETATSNPVTIYVSYAPTVNITSPGSGVFYAAPANITLTANATDSDGTISKVEFFNGATLIGAVTSSPWTLAWNDVPAGSYSITAKATDNVGLTKTSSAISVKSGTYPTVDITSPSNEAVLPAASFNIVASPATTNPGATISKVEFYRGATLVGTRTVTPWSISQNLAPGNYTFTAKVTDSYGAATTSSAINVRVNSSPTVSITSPSTNTFSPAPANYTFTASASDSDGNVTQVEFFAGSTLIGTATSAPWTTTWNDVPTGGYSITAKATDNDGGVNTSAAIKVGAGTSPAISLTSPLDNTVYVSPATYTLSASASTPNPGATITKVEWYRNGALLGSDTTAPYSAGQSGIASGTYVYTAKVIDSYGATATSEPVTVKVGYAPTVSISSPGTGVFYAAPATIPITATATDSDGTVSQVEFYSGTTLIGTATSSPWTITWNDVPPGTYSITAKATDNIGLTKTSTAISVRAGSYPTVSMSATATGTGTTPPFSFTLAATASTTNPGATITSVAFYKGTTLIGTDTTAPWGLTWSNVTAGTYDLTAKVTDSYTAVTISSPIRVIVGNHAPVIIDTPAETGTADTATRTSAFEYDPITGLLIKEIVEPENSDLCLVTIYTYDAYGNKTSITTRNCNGSTGSAPGLNSEAAAPSAGSDAVIETRTSSVTYDAQGRFPLTSTNALGQTETTSWNGSGTIASQTGPNSLTTSWSYDGFGRKLTESRADNTVTQFSYALCGSGITCPNSHAKYAVSTTQVGSSTNRNYYDVLNRSIQTETQDKDGGLIYTQIQYDKSGRVIQTSRPYKSSATPIWTTITYDILNRVLTTTAPDGGISKIAYSGLLTVSTNAKNQTRAEIRNTQGKTKSVTDAQNKTITYRYDAYGNLSKTTDPQGNVTTIAYDARGRKIAMNDPDQGVWTYVYDAVGLLKRQTDAKGQVVTFSYDKLGRMLARNEPDLISTWSYDICDATLNSAGKCVGKPVNETADNGYIRTLLYDSLGRPTAELDNVDSGYGVAKTYDSNGRVATLVYPTGFSIRNVYSGTGYLVEVRNTADDSLYWQANSMDAEGHVTSETYGNNVINTKIYDANTGRLSQAVSNNGNAVMDQSYVYDNLDNLTQRYDAVTGLNESFGYDSLNRLTATTAQSGSLTTSVTLTYDAIGNILSKSDVGTYTYGTVDSGTGQLLRPHAVTKIMMNDGVTEYASYAYDANGNQISGAGRTISWNSWNMPVQITGTTPNKSTPDGTASSSFGFVYNTAHERVKETLPDGTVLYNISPRVDTGIHVEKRVKPDGTVQYAHSLYAGNFPFGSVTTTTPPPENGGATTTNTRYYHADHLGSIVAITDEVGQVVDRRSYDAWGKRRNSNGTLLSNAFVTPEIRHGFTGHEELNDVGLIHMNGRLYDPVTGRFLGADPFIQFPDDLQSFNRYSYLSNNPLSGIDPSGHGLFSFISKIFKAVGKVISGVVRGVGHVISGVLRNTVLRTIISVVVAYYTGYWAGELFGSGAVINGAIGGFAGGLIAGRGDLKVALAGAFTGAAFGYVGDLAGKYNWNIAQKSLAHGVAGGISSEVGGGDFRSGFLSAGFAQYAGSWIPSGINKVGVLAARMVIGGAASQFGGGKFENGAMTAAFGYMFNELQHANLNGIGDTYLDDEFAPKVDEWTELARARGVELHFNEAFRTSDYQAALMSNPNAITPATAGSSLHEAGFAVDVNYSSLRDIPGGLSGAEQRQIIRETASQAGLSWGGNFRRSDPPHFYSDPGNRSQRIIDAQRRHCELSGSC